MERGINFLYFCFLFVFWGLFSYLFSFFFFVVSFFYGLILLLALGGKSWNHFYHNNISDYGEILGFDEPGQMELIKLQLDLKSEKCQWISDKECDRSF